MAQMTLKVTSNIRKYSKYAKELGIVTDVIAEQAAKVVQYAWANDVRVSNTSGYYDGRNGGSPGHYRDNIFVNRSGKNSWTVDTPVYYAAANEFGSPAFNMTPRPSAAQAGELGAQFYLKTLSEAIAAIKV